MTRIGPHENLIIAEPWSDLNILSLFEGLDK